MIHPEAMQVRHLNGLIQIKSLEAEIQEEA
jgi:hypothetical protein